MRRGTGEPIGRREQAPISGRGVQTGPREFYALGFRRLESGIERTWVRHLPGGPSDTVAASPDPDRDMVEPRNTMDCPGPGGAIYIFPARYDPEIVRTPAPGGQIVETDPVGYRLVFTDLEGDTSRVIHYETPDVFLTDSLWEPERARLDSMRAEAPGADCPRSTQRPERRPLVGSLL